MRFIIYQPYREVHRENPGVILGILNISARSFIPSEILTLSISKEKFVEMVNNMDENFLITDSWAKIK
jgi:hypothetical protein